MAHSTGEIPVRGRNTHLHFTNISSHITSCKFSLTHGEEKEIKPKKPLLIIQSFLFLKILIPTWYEKYLFKENNKLENL